MVCRTLINRILRARAASLGNADAESARTELESLLRGANVGSKSARLLSRYDGQEDAFLAHFERLQKGCAGATTTNAHRADRDRSTTMDPSIYDDEESIDERVRTMDRILHARAASLADGDASPARARPESLLRGANLGGKEARLLSGYDGSEGAFLAHLERLRRSGGVGVGTARRTIVARSLGRSRGVEIETRDETHRVDDAQFC